MSVRLLVVAIVGLFAVSSNAYDGKDLECRFLTAIESGFLSQHVKFSKADYKPALQEKVIDQYVKRLDPTKMYLLKSDVDQIKKTMGSIFNRILNKDCRPLEQVQKLLVERVKERAAFAKTVLDKNYKFDSTVEIAFDRDAKPFPATKAEAEEFIRKYVHFQISNYLSTDIKQPEAISNVKKYWDRVVKRSVETNADDVLAGYLDSFARALDPHSSFLAKDVLEDFEIQMSLSLEGIGATLSSQDGFTVVEALVPGGSAARSTQIQPQDKIMAVGQGDKGSFENVVDMDLRDVVRKIRGPKGSKVRLVILRKSGDEKKRFEVTLVRDKIKLEDEAASILYIDREVGGVKKKFGIINFPSFYSDSRRGGRSSAADLKRLIAEAKVKKTDGLILDLASNGGGSLDDAVKIAGLFFQTGNVVKQSSRDQSRGEQTLKDVDNAVDWAGPLVVLTSRISASASEIVAGTLQDYKRAVIVGNDHTFGKGSVQSVLPIPQNLGAIKVTVGMFFVPGGYSTQHRGVVSDIVIPGAYETDDVGEKYLDYSLPENKLPSFLSPDAYVKEGAQAWVTLLPEWIKSLADKSKARVAKDGEFKKIVEELEKSKARGKSIKLSEVVSDKDSKEKKDKAKQLKAATKVEKDKEYLKRPDIIEATNVLSDLMEIQGVKKVAKQN